MRLGRLWGPEPKYPLAESMPPAPAPELRFIAGPCSVESPGLILEAARRLKALGATMLRGGCYRAGTYPGPDPEPRFHSPSEFTARERLIVPERVMWLRNAALNAGMPWVTEVMDDLGLELASDAAWVQVGARHAQHYPLLKKVGRLCKRVLLKRGHWMKLDELMGSVEHLLRAGAEDVAVVERGIVTFEDHCRWSFSASAIACLKARTNLKVVADPSHGSGDRALVPALALAGVAAGADGLVCEVHPQPEKSASDAEQAIGYDEYGRIVKASMGIRSLLFA